MLGRKLLALSAAGAVGSFAGMRLERRRNEHLERQWLPRPLLAATALAPTELSPAVSPSEVAVPAKEVPGVPAEPPKGISRMSEIMRFGFPGLDNIKSHKYNHLE